jgi:hypothetical protein
MIAITVIAIAAGALFFRIDRLIEQKSFESDSGRLKTLLLSSRTLALNTHSDWRLDFKKTARGWTAQLICLEDTDLVYPAPKFSPKEMVFNNKPVEEISIDFFSTGLVRPAGTLVLKGKHDRKAKLILPELFHIEENGKIAPFHPSCKN